MWNHEKQWRFDCLREQEHTETLTESQQDELRALYDELYLLEATAHAPQAQSAEQEIAALEERNRQLATFLKEREIFLQRVKSSATCRTMPPQKTRSRSQTYV